MKTYNSFISNINVVTLLKDIKNIFKNYDLLKITENNIYQKLNAKFISSGTEIFCSFITFIDNKPTIETKLFYVKFNKYNIEMSFKFVENIYIDIDSNTYKIILKKIVKYLDNIKSPTMNTLLNLIDRKLPILDYDKFKIELNSYSTSIDYHKIILKCFENKLLDTELKNKYQYILNAKSFDLL
jgi:hypothetical protein